MKKPINILSLSTLFLMAGCAAPPLQYYTFSQLNPDNNAHTLNYSDHTPIIYISRVTVPDYLDTTDIVTRNQSNITHSVNGRMSSVLSIGVTDFITNSLSDRNPKLFVTSQAPIEPPAYQLMIHISRLDVQETANKNATITLEATWSMLPANEKSPVQKQKIVLTTQGSIANDADIIKLEQNVLTQLTNSISQNISQLRFS